MNDHSEGMSSRFDTVKLILSFIILLSGVAAFYYFSDQSLLIRVVGLLVVAGISVALLFVTDRGRAIWHFSQEARAEVRKVVWPTRKETLQTTLIVLVMVLIVGVMLWLFDSLLLWGTSILTGQGG